MLSIFLSIVLCFSVNSVFSTEITTEAYTWYLDNSPRKAYLHFNTVFERVPPRELKRSPKSKPRAFRKMKLKKEAMRKVSKIKFKKYFKSKSVYPAFSSAPYGAANMTPSGNIVVYFNKDVSDQTVKNWAQKNNYIIEKKFQAIGKSVWTIKTKLKVESIYLANKLRKLPFIQSAFPDWWRPLQLK